MSQTELSFLEVEYPLKPNVFIFSELFNEQTRTVTGMKLVFDFLASLEIIADFHGKNSFRVSIWAQFLVALVPAVGFGAGSTTSLSSFPLPGT